MEMKELIGRRFNLISRSDIRYVGTLHEINPEASTIALEDVISHGTEGRKRNPAEEIAPSASIYEYIVFRGSDVKDISVAEETKGDAQPEPPQVPNDPAILGSLSRPGPPQGHPPSQPPPQPQVSRPGPPSYPPQPQFQGFYPPYSQRFGPPGYPPGPGFPPYGAPPGWFPPHGHNFPQAPVQFPPTQVPIGPPGQQQRPAAPPAPRVPGGTTTVPKPTSELPVGEKASSRPVSKSSTPVPATHDAPSPSTEARPLVTETAKAFAPSVPAPGPNNAKSVPTSVASSSVAATPTTPSKVPPSGPKGERFVPAIPITNHSIKPAIPVVASHPLPNTVGNAASQGTAQAAITEATRAATAAVAAAMAKLPMPNSQRKPPPTNSSIEAVTKRFNDVRPFDNNRSYRANPVTRGGRVGHRGQHQTQSRKIEVPDTDFDFESSNAKFNKQDLVKEAIASGSPFREPEEKAINGTNSEGTNGNNTNSIGASTPIAYNKASSFFDNISSEIRDREEGMGGRGRERRGEEEKKNIETFGQGSVDGYRGGYRGRGRGRGSGGSRGRGGYGRGYHHGRGRGGMRGGRGASQATSVPAQT
ncbi:Scd6-like Sm domain containing protein [Elaphomyces granulatus]